MSTWQDGLKFDPNSDAERFAVIALVQQAFPDIPEALIAAAIDPAVIPFPERGRTLCALRIAARAVGTMKNLKG
jgi:hypothetical protein